MSDLLRMTGMYSGMDTDAVIQSLISVKKQKVTNLKNDQKKLQWKQETWQKLNTKLYSLYSKTLSNLRFSSSYAKKTTKVSDPTKATIVASEGAVNGAQSLEIKELAKSGYLTGAVVSKCYAKVTNDTTLEELGVTGGSMDVQIDGATVGTVTIDKGKKLGDFISDFNTQFAGEGLSMKFENGKITMDGPVGKEFALSSTPGPKGPTIVSALGLGNACTPDEHATGTVTGTKLHVPGSDYSDETNTTLEQLNIKSGKITVKANGKEFDIDVNEKSTVEQFVAEFNKKNAEEGTGIKMSVVDGKVSVEGPADGSKFTLSSSTDKAGKTVLQGLGLGSFGGTQQSGTITGNTVSALNKVVSSETFTAASKLSAIDPGLVGQTLTLTVGQGASAKQTEITLTSDMKISDLLNKLKEGGVNATYDEKNQRFFVMSTGTGLDKEFKLEASGGALKSLGLDLDASYENGSTATRIFAQDAEIVLNGATFTSDTNTFAINGLSITANAKTDENEPISITTDTDYDGIYDTIKDFLSEYNDIMNEMNKLYSADSARKFDMLTEEQKESMSDDEVEQWEGTIKGALLRRDGTLNSVMNIMKEAVNSKYDVNGKEMFLKDLGIGTLSYFKSTKENRFSLHIDGDADDEFTSTEKDRLRAALTEDPEGTISLFSQMAAKMYDSMNKVMMDSTTHKSIYKVYDDKQMKIDYDNYTTKIKEAEKKLSAYEDKWYKKFASMEVALSKLQSSQNTISSMLGQ